MEHVLSEGGLTGSTETKKAISPFIRVSPWVIRFILLLILPLVTSVFFAVYIFVDSQWRIVTAPEYGHVQSLFAEMAKADSSDGVILIGSYVLEYLKPDRVTYDDVNSEAFKMLKKRHELYLVLQARLQYLKNNTLPSIERNSEVIAIREMVVEIPYTLLIPPFQNLDVEIKRRNFSNGLYSLLASAAIAGSLVWVFQKFLHILLRRYLRRKIRIVAEKEGSWDSHRYGHRFVYTCIFPVFCVGENVRLLVPWNHPTYRWLQEAYRGKFKWESDGWGTEDVRSFHELAEKVASKLFSVDRYSCRRPAGKELERVKAEVVRNALTWDFEMRRPDKHEPSVLSQIRKSAEIICPRVWNNHDDLNCPVQYWMVFFSLLLVAGIGLVMIM